MKMELPGSVPYQHVDVPLVLLPQHAIWWPAQRALIVADVHLGKGTAFRSLGVPVPGGSSTKDLARITTLLEKTRAERLFILGDFIHGRLSHQPELHAAMDAWRAANADVAVTLIRGNHDQRAGRLSAAFDIGEVDGSLVVGGLTLRHDPTPSEAGEPVLAGHIHPVVSLRDFDRSRVTLPCFVFEPDGVGILPSFGTFTGGHPVRQRAGQDCFACAAGRVIKVSIT